MKNIIYLVTDTFRYEVVDVGTGNTGQATVSINVLPLNQPPVARDDTYSGASGNPVTGNVLANDYDPDGDPLTLTWTSNPVGNATLNPDGTFEYRGGVSAPHPGWADTFTYEISDGNGGTDTATITVTVTGRNDGPTATDNDYSVNEIAKLHEVDVLNVNELSNSLKPVYLPGEELTVTIVKEGKEPGQGVAYLDDGTMVVVEQASSYVGQLAPVAVTSVLQTRAGKMIFADLKLVEKPTATDS